jgi:hypothetical protein
MVKNPETQEKYAKACNEFYALFRESYSKYIGIINPVKLTLPYENNVVYGSIEFSQRFLFELLSTIDYYEKYLKNR